MSDLFGGVKSVPTPEVVRAFFPNVELKRDGNGRVKALCVFHIEDTPSFTAYEKGWKCYGCGAHGSNIDLLLKSDLASSPRRENLAASLTVKYCLDSVGGSPACPFWLIAAWTASLTIGFKMVAKASLRLVSLMLTLLFGMPDITN